MKILVGSQNPVKIKSVKSAFSKFFDDIEVKGISVDSKVPDQPINDDTFIGAKNRAEALYKLNDIQKLDAEYFVGIEGGVSKIFDRWFAYGCMCIMNSSRKVSFGTSPHFELPKSIMEELLKGKELGEVMDEIMNEENTKHKSGAIGFFTNGVMDRKELYESGLITALVPFLHERLYF